jgi:hypothetical protein
MRHGTRSVGSKTETSAAARSRAFEDMQQAAMRCEWVGAGASQRVMLQQNTVTNGARFSSAPGEGARFTLVRARRVPPRRRSTLA